jgi:hypothetical protein
VLSAAAMRDDQLKHGTRPSSNERVRLFARRSSGQWESPMLAESQSVW